jgi:hypothetical protein
MAIRYDNQTTFQGYRHTILVCFAETGIERQTDGFTVVFLGFWKIAWPEAELVVIGLKVDWDVMQVDADTRFSQRFKYLKVGFADFIQLQANNVKMESRAGSRVLPRQGERQVLQQGLVTGNQFVPPLHESIQPRHLAYPKRSLNVSHAVVVTQLNLLVVPGASGLMM